MKNKNILVFGSTGFIGRSLMKRLLQNGDKLICPVRNANRVKRNILSGDIGQIEVIEFDIHNLEEIKTLIANSDLVINLIGILYERSHHRWIVRPDGTKGFGGLYTQLPIYSIIFIISLFASMGLPGLSGFISEALIFLGIYQAAICEKPFTFSNRITLSNLSVKSGL